MADVIRETSPQHQQAIVRNIVERVEVRGREVISIEPRSEARPFFDGMAVAPTDLSPHHPRSALDSYLKVG